MNSEVLFSDKDKAQIERQGLSVDQVMEQIQIFREGAAPLKLNRPCTLHDGIRVIGEEEGKALETLHDEEARAGRMLKFVPASGAASRMFKDWYWIMAKGIEEYTETGSKIDFLKEIKDILLGDLKKYAFFEDLKAVVAEGGQNLDELMKKGEIRTILSSILTADGMNYGQLPKALLKFHKSPEGSRAAIEEHLVEAALYAKDAGGRCRLHFTVSVEHEKAVAEFLKQKAAVYEKRLDASFDLSLSVQHAYTDTLAVDMNGLPFRNPDGTLVFRPGGHGALLENLNLLDGDIIFIKNIDNVVPDSLKSVTVLYKKILGGYLIKLQKVIFAYAAQLAAGGVSEKELGRIVEFCKKDLCLSFPADFPEKPLSVRCEQVFQKLNRPLRVCGVVRNVGEPGGGPFWVEDEDGALSLQIVEEAQINPNSESQRTLWKTATHFNPVDLVCGVRDYSSQKFDLKQFINRKAIFIARKTEKGRELQALELPGLWNGAMADWNTVFVEVPLETFNPVKTVNDLLRPQHQ
ncbi:protein of unknown function [Syntrophus gentianae]|uniref:DUF4301 domain-containing protein n=1 Tax=Syntrophus gentianae TaxID=43775 RepID=A0A1H7WQ75_9BACT|nr:DUF4301 family protein [Syntrophus gentianae]SEM23652.1 protein of unknown function [Syntrophus gentianae]